MKKIFNYFALIFIFVSTSKIEAQTYTAPATGMMAGIYAGGCPIGTNTGTYVDDGGTGGNYSLNINSVYQTICPTVAGESIRLTFTEFNMENGFDYITIGNGPAQNSSPFVTAPADAFGWITGTPAVPFTYTATNSSGCLTIRQYSDNMIAAAGFQATITTVNNGTALAAGNSDCSTSSFICSNAAMSDNSNGPGLSPNDGCGASCLSGEVYSNWYTFTAKTSGTLGITIGGGANDYDFALYGPNDNCSNGTPLRCSFASGTGNTGIGGGAVDNSEDASGDGWVALVNVVAGESYKFLVNNWSPGVSNFGLTFTGTATLGTEEPTINSPNVCGTVSSTLTASTITSGGSYLWSTGEMTQSINVSPASTTSYTCTYTYLACPSSTPGSGTVTVTPTPTASISYAGTPFCTTNGVSAVTISGTNSYTGGIFSSTAGLSINAGNGEITPSTSTAGSYTVNYAIPAVGACPSTNTNTNIVVDQNPTANAGTIADVCFGTTPTVVGASATNGTISWSENGASSISAGGNTTTPTYIPNAGDISNTVTLTMNVTSSNSCANPAPVTASFLINPLPSATISGGGDVCQNAASPTVTFTGSNGTAPYTFSYNINGGANQTVVSNGAGVATVLAPTNIVGGFAYNLTNVQDNSSTTCSQAVVQSVNVNVNPLPTAIISGTTSVCQNAGSPNITFTGSNGTAPYTFTYNINGGANQTVSTTIGNSVTVSVPTNTVGGFTYSLTSVQDNSSTLCTQSVLGQSVVITVNPLPTATISGGGTACQNAASPTVTFTGANGTAPYTFSYNIDGGPTQTVVSNGLGVAVISASTAVVGTFNYNLLSVIDASSTTCSQNQAGFVAVTVNLLPTFLTTPTDPTTCNGSEGTILISGLSNSTSYNVTYSSGGPVTGPNTISSDGAGEILISGLSAGTYSLTVALTSTGCSTTQNGIVLNNTGAPNVVINNPTAVCSPNTVDITTPAVTAGSDGGLTFTYWTDNGAISSLSNPNAISVSGTYYIKGEIGMCSSIKPVVVEINQTPNLVITNPASACSPNTVDITAASVTLGSTNVGTLSYWTDNGATTSLSNPNAIAVSGQYYIKADNNGCVDINQVDVTIVLTPTVTGPISTAACDNFQLLQITGTNQNNPLYYYTSGGVTVTYAPGSIVNSTVTLIMADSNGVCGNSLPITITINQTPNVGNFLPVEACDSYVLPALTVGNYFSGPLGTGTSYNAGQTISNDKTMYVYAETGTNPNCFDDASFVIDIVTTPIVTGPLFSSECEGSVFVLPAIEGTNLTSNKGYYYTSGNVTAIYHEGDVVNESITLIVADSVGNCGSNVTYNIILDKKPEKPIVSPDTTYCIGASVITMTAQAQGSGTLSWYLNDTTNLLVDNQNSYVPSSEVATYIVLETSANANCKGDTAHINISFKDCSLIIPSAFTPDNDKMNDIWEIGYLDDNYPDNIVRVYNRWGNLVYESEKGKYSNKPWDGKYNGEDLPVASYYYTIETEDSSKPKLNGIVSIIRK